jgi:SecY interacting protein Syd
MQKIQHELDNFVHAYCSYHQDSQQIEFDPDWPSVCYQQQGQRGDWVNWQPVKREIEGVFNNLECGLELVIDPQLKLYYSRYWSNNLNAESAKGQLQLLMPWNQDDFEQLQQNLAGHVLMKRRLKQQETLFFALTDEEDLILSVENKTGNVVLEQVGLPAKEVIAKDLADFIGSLQPR